MKTRGWLIVLMGSALIAFGAYSSLASQSANASVQSRTGIVPVGYNAPGPDSNWVEVPSGNSRPTSRSDAGTSGGRVDNRWPSSSGSGNARVTIIEYGDYECPYCRGDEPVLRELRHKYGSNLRIVFRDFPLKSHPGSMEAAMASRCAGAQGAFQQYHDALYSWRWGFTTSQYESIAQYLNLDIGQFANCLNQQRYKGEVEREKEKGESLGVRETPTFFINGEMMAGEQSLSAFESAINARLGPDGQ